MTHIADHIETVLQTHRGIFIGEEHGDMSHAQAVIDAIPTLQARGVRTFYFELIPASENWRLEQWNTDNDSRALTEWFNERSVAFSENMWETYAGMLSALHNAGIRVVGIDTLGLNRGTETNKAWARVINEDQKKHPGAFVGYGGRGHLRSDLAEVSTIPIHNMLEIPALYLNTTDKRDEHVDTGLTSRYAVGYVRPADDQPEIYRTLRHTAPRSISL